MSEIMIDENTDSKQHLREFQARLSERLNQAGTGAGPAAAKLGLVIGEDRWLVDLAEAGEIVPIPSNLSPVPLTKDWFKGLVNLRGTLFAVADLSRFSGGDFTPMNKESRLLAFASRLNFNAAILVSRMLGLRNLTSFKVDASAPVSVLPWVGRQYLDAEGRSWRELNLALLAADERFLMVNR